jgi:hypothetical protein
VETATADTPHTGIGWSAPHFDEFQFDNRRLKAVSSTSGITFSDFDRMHIYRRRKTQTRRLPTPEYANNDASLRRVVLGFCEASLLIATPRSGSRDFYKNPEAERLERIARKAQYRTKEVKATLDRLMDRHHAYAKTMTPEARRKLETEIKVYDARLLILPRLAALVTSVLYQYYRLGLDSVTVANELRVSPQYVRQLCRRAGLIWDELNGRRVTRRHSANRKNSHSSTYHRLYAPFRDGGVSVQI